MVPDTAEIIENLLAVETDAACWRNAFVVLNHTDAERAWNHFGGLNERLGSLDAASQLAISEFVKSDRDKYPEHIPRNVKAIVALLEGSSSTVVKFEAATALMMLSDSPAAIQAVASTYVDLAVKETDNNAKLMVLERYAKLQRAYPALVSEEILDVLRVLGASDLTVRQRALDILSKGASARHAPEIVAHLIKEVSKAVAYERAVEYQQALLQVIDSCAHRFPIVTANALNCFCDVLASPGNANVLDAVRYSKEILDRHPTLRAATLSKLMQILNDQVDAASVSAILWIIGEFGEDDGTLNAEIITNLIGLLGPLSLKEATRDEELVPSVTATFKKPTMTAARKLNPDGTYATESAMTATASRDRDVNIHILRKLILAGNYTVAVSLGNCLCKLIVHCTCESPRLKGLVMLALTSILKTGMSELAQSPIDKDTFDRLMFYLKFLAQPTDQLSQAFRIDCRRALEEQIKAFGMKNGGSTGVYTSL